MDRTRIYGYLFAVRWVDIIYVGSVKEGDLSACGPIASLSIFRNPQIVRVSGCDRFLPTEKFSGCVLSACNYYCCPSQNRIPKLLLISHGAGRTSKGQRREDAVKLQRATRTQQSQPIGLEIWQTPIIDDKGLLTRPGQTPPLPQTTAQLLTGQGTHESQQPINSNSSLQDHAKEQKAMRQDLSARKIKK